MLSSCRPYNITSPSERRILERDVKLNSFTETVLKQRPLPALKSRAPNKGLHFSALYRNGDICNGVSPPPLRRLSENLKQIQFLKFKSQFSRDIKFGHHLIAIHPKIYALPKLFK